MGRLIDADANREDFKKIVYRTLINCTITTKEKFNLIMTAFDNIPTAYDVEKVVEELEKEKEIHTKNYNMSLYKDYPEVKQRYEQTQLVIDNAIEKVRKGGING